MNKRGLQEKREETMMIMADMRSTDRFIYSQVIVVMLVFITVRSSGLRDECVLCQLVVGVAYGRGQ